MLRSALRAALAVAVVCAGVWSGVFVAGRLIGAAWPLVWLAAQLAAWWGHVRVAGQGAATYPGWPWQPRSWFWVTEDLIVYSSGYLPALAVYVGWSVVRAAYRGDSWVPAAAAARQRLATWYQSRLLRRSGERGRMDLILRGLAAIRQYMDSRGALYRVDRVRDRGQGGQVVDREVRWPLVFVSWEIMENSEEAFVVRYSATFYRPEPQVLAAWRSLPQDLPQLLGVPPDQITVDPAGAIIWHAIGSPAPEALPEAPPAPELPEAEVWSQLLADDDGGPLVEGGPPTELLSPPTRGRGRPQEGRTSARQVLAALGRLGVNEVKVDRINVGPATVTVILSPPPGSPASCLLRTAAGIGDEMGLEGVTCRPRGDGSPGVAVTVPRAKRDPVPLRALLTSYGLSDMALPVSIGVAADGAPLLLDLASAPHVLVAGTTGSGKSVGMTCFMISIMMFRSPADVRLVLCDPKLVEFAPFRASPHLICPVLSESEQMQAAVLWLTSEMDRRYKLFSDLGVKDLVEYNKKIKDGARLPRIVLVVDELADLLMAGEKAARKQVETGLIRLAQKARAAGLHLLLATQKPTVEVVPSLLKGNIPTRIAFKTATQTESMVILDRSGAETLGGKGELIMVRADSTTVRGQGAWVSGAEAEAVSEWWAQRVPQEFDAGLLSALSLGGGAPVSAVVHGGPAAPAPPGEMDMGDDGW